MKIFMEIAKSAAKLLIQNKLKIVLIISVVMFFVVFAEFTVTIPINEAQSGKSIVNFDEGWEVITEKGREPIEYLPIKLSIPVKQQVVVENTLPENLSEDMTMTMHSSRQHVRVLIEGVCVYEYHGYKNPISTSPVSKVLYLQLVEEYSGKSIQLELTSDSYVDSGRIDEIYYGSTLECVQTATKLQMHILILYSALGFVAVMLAILFLLIRKFEVKYITILLQGIFLLCFSLHMITEYNIVQMIFQENKWLDVISYLTFLLMPFPFIANLYIFVKNKVLKITLLIESGCLIIASLAGLILHTGQYLDISTFIFGYELLVVAFLGLNIFLAIIAILIGETTYMLTMFFAMGILFITIVVDMCSHFYYVLSYYNSGGIVASGIISYLLILGGVMINRTVTAIEDADDVKHQLMETRVSMMISQIQPHFIYNTLNSIQTLIDIKPQEAIKMIDHFSKYLRTHIDTLEMEKKILFREELCNIREYVSIELVRFPRIRVEYDIQEDMFLVSALSIQPLVENAIKHGVSKKPLGGTVLIKSYIKNGFCTIKIIDDGIGFEGARGSIHHRSVGMKNIAYRLSHAMNATVYWDSTPDKGTEVTVKMPKENVINENNFSR